MRRVVSVLYARVLDHRVWGLSLAVDRLPTPFPRVPHPADAVPRDAATEPQRVGDARVEDHLEMLCDLQVAGVVPRRRDLAEEVAALGEPRQHLRHEVEEAAPVGVLGAVEVAQDELDRVVHLPPRHLELEDRGLLLPHRVRCDVLHSSCLASQRGAQQHVVPLRPEEERSGVLPVGHDPPMLALQTEVLSHQRAVLRPKGMEFGPVVCPHGRGCLLVITFYQCVASAIRPFGPKATGS